MGINTKITIVDDQQIAIFSEMAQRLKSLLEPHFKLVNIQSQINHQAGMVNLILNPHHPKNCVQTHTEGSIYLGWDLTNARSVEEYTSRNYGKLNVLLVDVWEKQFLLKNTRFLPFAKDMVSIQESQYKDIDIALIGDRTADRTKIVEACRKKGYRVFYTDKVLYGAERDKIVSRSKIMLDVPRDPCFIFLPSVRECMAVVNQCLLITSGIYMGRKPYVVSTNNIDMINIVEYYLLHDDERQKYINTALVETTKYSVENILSQIICEISHE